MITIGPLLCVKRVRHLWWGPEVRRIAGAVGRGNVVYKLVRDDPTLVGFDEAAKRVGDA